MRGLVSCDSLYWPRGRSCIGSRRRSSSCHVCRCSPSPCRGCCRGRLRSLAAQSLEGILGDEVSKCCAARRRTRPSCRLHGSEAVLDHGDVHELHSLRRSFLHAPDSACRWPLWASSGGVADLFADPALPELSCDLRQRALELLVGLAAIWTVAGPRCARSRVSLGWRRPLAWARSRLSTSKSPTARL